MVETVCLFQFIAKHQFDAGKEGAPEPVETTGAIRIESVEGLVTIYSSDGKQSRVAEAGMLLKPANRL